MCCETICFIDRSINRDYLILEKGRVKYATAEMTGLTNLHVFETVKVTEVQACKNCR